MTQAVILAGGKGTRLASRLNGKPKPLVEVDGIPLLQRQIEALISHGVDDVVVLVNHAADQIGRFLADHAFSAQVSLVDDGDPRGTAGATLACLAALREEFVVVYGDTLFDIDIGHILAEHRRRGADATLLLHPNDHPDDSDLVEIDDEGMVIGFHPYPHPPGALYRNLVNAAFYVINRDCLLPWVTRMPVADFAKDLFPAMVAQGAQLAGYVSYEYIKDIGTPARLDKAVAHLRKGLVSRARRSERQKAVFVDRDGTLNHLRGHIRDADQLELYEGAGEAVKRLNQAEYRVLVVTNQPVLARGECDVAGLAKIHARLETELGREGAYLDGISYCPHHPDRGFEGEIPDLKCECDCRKPGTAMVLRAAESLNIDLAESWMIGDSTADIMLASRTGMRSILVETGEGGRDGKWEVSPDRVAVGILDAVDIILENS